MWFGRDAASYTFTARSTPYTPFLAPKCSLVLFIKDLWNIRFWNLLMISLVILSVF